MAKRKAKIKKKAARRPARRAVRRDESVLTKKELYLNRHDEEKALLFATGIMLGIGIAATILGTFVYGGVVAIAIALVLLFLERRQVY